MLCKELYIVLAYYVHADVAVDIHIDKYLFSHEKQHSIHNTHSRTQIQHDYSGMITKWREGAAWDVYIEFS